MNATKIKLSQEFLVWRKSENTNSFGLYQMYLMSRDGEAYTSCANSFNAKEVGEVINGEFILDLENDKASNCTFQGHELTERLFPDAPQDVINDVWKIQKRDKDDLIRIQFKEWDCILEVKWYQHGRVALLLIGAEGTEYQFEPIATATTNLPQFHLKENEVFIKEYSENEGMVKALMDAGIIGKEIGRVNNGYSDFPKHELLIKTQ